MLIIEAVGPAAPAAAQQDHFVTLREELESIDEYLDIESRPLRAAAEGREADRPGTLDIDRAEHDPAAAGRELDQARPLAQGRRRPHHDPQPCARTATRSSKCIDDGLGMTRRAARARARRRHRPEQRQRAAAHDLRRGYQLKLTACPGEGTCASASRFPSWRPPERVTA